MYKQRMHTKIIDTSLAFTILFNFLIRKNKSAKQDQIP